ncbi:MAG: FMN-binding protein [Gammaproteobacteria bacterium]|nr:FMN-binding protein [Gammaproteobacteria bacterium]
MSSPALLAAQGTFSLSEQEFLETVFEGDVPQPQRLWVKGALREELTQILGHKPGFLRAPFWRKDNTTVWVLNEIGKTKPITTGVVVKRAADGADRIASVKVLAFRESRGWEVKYSFFTDQFKQLQRKAEGGLSSRIDGISGATLSVKALKKQAEAALLLNAAADT